MTEDWRPYPNDPRFQVSDHGRVRGVRGGILSQSLQAGGYPQVGLGGKARVVHRMVLETFVGPRPDGLECCHLDDVKTNNHLSNLRWGTHPENVAEEVRNGRHYQANKVECSRGHRLEGPNMRINSSGARVCKACAYRSRYGVGSVEDRDKLADSYYERVMSGVG